MRKKIIYFLLFIILCGCGARVEIDTLEKNGALYEYNDILSFYYPKDWAVEKDEMKMAISISDPTSSLALYFDAYTYVEENPKEQLLEFYLQDLMEHSIVINDYSVDVLDSGLECFRVEGYDQINESCFMEVIIYLNNIQYIYSFVGNENDYEKNLERLESYVYSLNIEYFINE